MAKFKKRLLEFIFLILWRLKFDSLIARLLSELVGRNNRTPGGISGSFAILAFDRSIFNNDVTALKDYAQKQNLPYKFFLYPSYIRAALINSIWPSPMKVQISYYPLRHKYAKFLQRISDIFAQTLRLLEKRFGIKVKVVLSGNIDYAADYPWTTAVKKTGAKFIVLNKESIIYSPYFGKDLVNIYRRDDFYFEGDAVLFYCESGRKQYIAAGAVSEEGSFVTGCPRVDGLVELFVKDRERQQIVLLPAFMDPTYRASKLFEETLSALHEDDGIAGRVVIKCRDTREVGVLKIKFPRFDIVTGPFEKFIAERPLLCVGFNSTACLDTLVAGVPLVIPWWADGETLGEDAMLGPHTSDFHLLARSGNELRKIVGDFLKGETKQYLVPSWRENERMRAFIEDKYSLLDGKNCERFFEFLDAKT